MDATQIVVVLILAVICVAAFTFYGERIKLKFKTLFGSFELEGSNQSGPAPPSVLIEDAKAGGGIRAEDKTGGGTNIRRAEAAGDITARSENPGAAVRPKA